MNASFVLAVIAAGATASASDTPFVLNATAEATIVDSDTTAIGRGKAFVGTTNFGQLRRALVRFDLSSLPDGEVATAELAVEITDLAAGGPFTAGVHRVLTDWNEGPALGGGRAGGIPLPAGPDDATWSATGLGTMWANQGGDFVATATSSRTMPGIGDTVFFDVTDDVRAFRDGTTNYGWILVSQSEGVSQQVAGLSTDDMVFSVEPMRLEVFIASGNPADLAPPFGVLDLADVDAFIAAFLGG